MRRVIVRGCVECISAVSYLGCISAVSYLGCISAVSYLGCISAVSYLGGISAVLVRACMCTDISVMYKAYKESEMYIWWRRVSRCTGCSVSRKYLDQEGGVLGDVSCIAVPEQHISSVVVGLL